MSKKNVIIIGAAGRDFHNFNTYYRNNDAYNVVAFTAAQIPHIEDRLYPAALAGANYPNGVPIYPERQLGDLLRDTGVRPVTTGLFAGALAYTRYGWFLRRLMRRIAATDGHSTDTTADHEFTDWATVERFCPTAIYTQ